MARHVLQRIVEQLQQAQQIQNLAGVVKSAALDDQRHAGALEFLRKDFRLARRRAQQHRHVAPFDRAKGFFSSSQISWPEFFNSPNRSATSRASFADSSKSANRSSSVSLASGSAPRSRASFEAQEQFRARRWCLPARLSTARAFRRAEF